MSDRQKDSQKSAGGVRDTAEPSPLKRFERHIGRRILSGFLLLVPLMITIWILVFIVNQVDDFFRPALGESYLDILDFPGIGIIVTMALFYVVGAFFAGQRFQALQDAVLSRIPIVKTIYGVARQATQSLSSPTSSRFNRVVFLDWPRPGVRAMGFVTGSLDFPGEGGSTLLVVYIPTVPNPTSGMLAWVPEEEVVDAGFTMEEAMKAVFSGGIVLPKSSDVTTIQSPLPLDKGTDR